MVVDYSSNNGFSSVNWGEFFTRKLLDREVKLKVPPRVRSFLWMLTIDRIPTKEFLVKRRVQLQHIPIRCLWCERVPERADHLFFKCKYIEGFWYKFFKWWEVEWKLVEGFAEFYSLCYNMKLSRVRRSLWLLSISTTCSSVWIARNEIIFERNVMIMVALIFQSKMRAILWIRVVYDELMCPPPQGCLKFNVCGIANEEVASCGGVPRDIEGVARALFSSPIAANDADSTKTGAVFIALDLFLSMGWKTNGSFIVEIGSKMVYNLCLNKDMRPSLLQTTFSDIERKIEQVGSVVFSMADQKGNEMASTLAVVGINCDDMFKAWW
ncbi:hypothetical protein Gohar_009251 [Gossypium harknessii]|uniref:Reverse transcriptase zinc-binding domain-containing protein n=1 Tax=Gossypium harknessii TaxID=34285 RepID=A0A7J9GPI1_9ROSI|nr:hypothetical protein [Gossypium harknessii]